MKTAFAFLVALVGAVCVAVAVINDVQHLQPALRGTALLQSHRLLGGKQPTKANKAPKAKLTNEEKAQLKEKGAKMTPAEKKAQRVGKKTQKREQGAARQTARAGRKKALEDNKPFAANIKTLGKVDKQERKRLRKANISPENKATIEQNLKKTLNQGIDEQVSKAKPNLIPEDQSKVTIIQERNKKAGNNQDVISEGNKEIRGIINNNQKKGNNAGKAP